MAAPKPPALLARWQAGLGRGAVTEVLLAVAVDVGKADGAIVTRVVAVRGVSQHGRLERGAEVVALREPAREAAALPRAEIGHAVAVDVGEANRRVLLDLVPASVGRERGARDLVAEARALRVPARDAAVATQAEVGLAVAVDVGESNGAPVVGLVPGLVVEVGADDVRREAMTVREPALDSPMRARADVRRLPSPSMSAMRSVAQCDSSSNEFASSQSGPSISRSKP